MLGRPRRKIKELHAKYERQIIPFALLAGFIWDNLTLRRVDLWIENLVMIVYLSVAGLTILLSNAIEAGRVRGRFFERLSRFLPFVLQFTFGGLFSAFTVFYIRSGSILVSWPFLLALLALIIGNEVFREKYQKFVFQMSIYFTAIFSYSVFAVPVFLKEIGPDVFLISGSISLVLISLVSLLSYIVVPERFRKSLWMLFLSVGGIYFAFNALYFLNVIPPIPLSMKESGVFHSLERTGQGYVVEYEPGPWYSLFESSDYEFHWRKGEPVYFYSAIFAPTQIEADIRHRWMFRDEKEGKWVLKSLLGFPIVGGRDGGYRGYSLKYNVEPGRWRVDVITDRGQVLGRNYFEIIEAKEKPDLRTEIK